MGAWGSNDFDLELVRSSEIIREGSNPYEIYLSNAIIYLLFFSSWSAFELSLNVDFFLTGVFIFWFCSL